MDDWGKLNETTLPEKEEFYSNLTLSQAGFFKLFKGGWGGGILVRSRNITIKPVLSIQNP